MTLWIGKSKSKWRGQANLMTRQNRASASSRGEATFALFMGMLPQYDWLGHVAMPSMRYESFTIIHDGIKSFTTHHIVVLFYRLVRSI